MNINKNKEIGLRIKCLRKEKSLTQALFAEKIRRDRTLISKIESGECELSPSVRLAICNIFGVRREWLLGGKGEIYDDRWALLEARAKELGEDIYLKLSTLKAFKHAYQELLEIRKQPDHTGCEQEYIDKLITILRHKDEGTVSAITQNIDTFLRVPDKKNPSKSQA